MSLNKLNIAICDDESDIVTIIRDSVRFFFQSHQMEPSLQSFSSSKAFLATVDKNVYDLIFLDIDMPEIDGINLAIQVHSISPETTIIFVSNREDKVFDTFQVQPFGFVRKTRFLGEITKVLNRYIIEIEKKKEKKTNLLIKTNGQEITLDINDIIYIECQKHDQRIHTEKEDIIVHDTMSNIEQTTSPYGLRRVHKGFIINLHKVKAIVSDGVMMIDSSFIPINRKKIAEFKHEFLETQQLYGSNILKKD